MTNLVVAIMSLLDEHIVFGVRPVFDRNAEDSRTQKVRNGLPEWSFSVGFESETFGGTELVPVNVKVPLDAKTVKSIRVGSYVTFKDLMMRTGEFDGRAYISFSASGLTVDNNDTEVQL